MNTSPIDGGIILVIDDDREDFLIMRERLRDAGLGIWEVEWASTYDMGRERLFGSAQPETRYRAVVVDYQMGQHNGLELIREAVARNFAAPFILITGRGSEEVDWEALRAGAALYLTKEEATSALLERTIRYAIELSQKEQALRASEASLRRSESQLRYQAALLDSMNDAVIAADQNYCISAWNPAAERLYGWKAEEAIGQLGLELLKTEFPEQDKEKMLTIIAETGLWRGEVTQVNRNGIRFPVEVSSIVLTDPEGQTTGYLSVNRDITGRKVSEARAAAEREWLRTTLASIGDAVITCDAHGAVTFLNQVAEDLTGWRNAEAYGKPLGQVFPIVNEQTRRPAADPAVRVLESGLVVGLANHTALVNRAGLSIPIEDSAAPIKDASGQVLGVVIVFHDVAEKRQAEQALRDSEGRFRIALSNSSIAVFSADLDLRYTWFYGTGMGPWPERFIGKRDEELLPIEAVAEFVAAKRLAIKTQAAVHQEIRLNLPAGLMVMAVAIEPLFDSEGHMTGIIGALFDVTELRRLEEERREYLTNMEVHHRLLEYREKERQEIALDLHDGPVQELSGLLFKIQFTKESVNDTAVKQDLEQIGETIKQIIRDLRGTVNSLRPPSLIHFGVARAIEFHAEDYLEKHPEMEIELSLNPLGEGIHLSETVHLAIFRIYQEALNNITRHAQATRAWVHFGREGNDIVLEVRDNGQGFSLSSALTEYTAREHFGLAGMRERADAVGGKFKIISEPGVGTKVRVEIPVEGKESLRTRREEREP